MKYLFVFTFLTFATVCFSQYEKFNWDIAPTEADSLRGTLSPLRNCYDVQHYHLKVYFDLENKYISGFNRITANFLKKSDTIQLDLFENMAIDSILIEGKLVDYSRKHNAFFVYFPFEEGKEYVIDVNYSGNPAIAKMAPWDGGFTFGKDGIERPFVSVSCEGFGASSWWPNKDHLSDNPDRGMLMEFLISNPDLSIISNGRRRGSIEKEGDFYKHGWTVNAPITNYNVSFYIGHFLHFSDIYKTSSGKEVDLDYYVIDYNLELAKEHFKQVHSVLSALELYFGPYPFIEDGYKLVEAPYLGMEHQSGIAYGNRFTRGYLGKRIPAGHNWDYIIMHETGHEWWGNSIGCKDHAEMWIQEAMTTYSEALFVEALYNKKEYVKYLEMQRDWIQNKFPIIGPMGINYEFSDPDIYYKGAWIYHTLRSIMDDDLKWKELLYAMYDDHKFQKITSDQLLSYVQKKLNLKNFDAFVEQYFHSTYVPLLQIHLTQSEKDNTVTIDYKFENCHKDLTFPIKMVSCDSNLYINPSNEWQKLIVPFDSCLDFSEIEKYYYINLNVVENAMVE